MSAQITNIPTCALADGVFIKSFRSGQGSLGSGAFCALHDWHSRGLNGSIISYKFGFADESPMNGLIELLNNCPVAKSFEYKGVHILLPNDEEIVLDAPDLPVAMYRYIGSALKNEILFNEAINNKKISQTLMNEAINLVKKDAEKENDK